MNIFKKSWDWVKLHKIITIVVLAALIGGGYYWHSKTSQGATQVQYITGPATKQTITSSIDGSGTVAAENKIDLKPGSAGALTEVDVKQGDTVKAGQTIAIVDERSNSVAVDQARASVASAQANYDKLVAGLTGTDLQAAQLTLDEAKQALDKANRDLLANDLSLEASNTITTASVTLSGSYSGSSQGNYDISVYNTNDGLYYSATGLGNQSAPVNRGVALPLGNGLYITFGTTGNIDTSTKWTIEVPNTKSSSYQSSLDAVTSAQNALEQAQLTYDSKVAPPTNADVSQAQAQIETARAQLATAELNYDNNILKSPFDGIVAAVNNQKGDQVTASTAVATVITTQKIAVMSLNEVDAAKVKVGQKASLTFDALDGLNIAGEVAEIDTIGTVTQGVVTYNGKIGFDTQDDRIKPGMSVSASIITDVQPDVLSVPTTAVKSSATGSYVQVLDAQGQPQNVLVQVGISNDTDTQIISGLTEGQMVVTQTITKSKTTSTTTRTGTTGLGLPGLGGGAVRATGGGGAQFRSGN